MTTWAAVLGVVLLAIFSTRVGAQRIELELVGATEEILGSAEVGLVGEQGCAIKLKLTSRSPSIELSEVGRSCGIVQQAGGGLGAISGVKVLLLFPGFEARTLETSLRDQVWRVELSKLPSARIRGSVRPVPADGHEVAFSYCSQEGMRFFQRIDGFCPTIEIGRAPLRTDGSFEFEVPDISRDAFLSTAKALVTAHVWRVFSDGRREIEHTRLIPFRTFYSSEVVLDLER